MTIILFQKAIRCKVMQSTNLLFKWTYNEHSWICFSKLQVRLEKSGMLFYPSFRSRVPHSSSESWFMSWVITWCFCMLSVLSICSIWLLFKKAIPWLPQDDYDKLALQYLSYARCLILDAFLWLSEWWTVINLRTTFCQDLGAHCPRIFHLLFEVWVPQGHCCEPWLQLEVSIDRSSINGH